ncbi:MAG: STAS domain-containing protein [Loktanella sp.]|nr:STAS domain-containing protein [Loktanella sp.]
MTANTATFVLPPALTFDACAILHDFLSHAQGSDIILDGSRVTRVGGICAQLLACASIIWAGNGRSFVLNDPSDVLREGLQSLALWPLPHDKDGA